MATVRQARAATGGAAAVTYVLRLSGLWEFGVPVRRWRFGTPGLALDAAGPGERGAFDAPGVRFAESAPTTRWQ